MEAKNGKGTAVKLKNLQSTKIDSEKKKDTVVALRLTPFQSLAWGRAAGSQNVADKAEGICKRDEGTRRPIPLEILR